MVKKFRITLNNGKRAKIIYTPADGKVTIWIFNNITRQNWDEDSDIIDKDEMLNNDYFNPSFEDTSIEIKGSVVKPNMTDNELLEKLGEMWRFNPANAIPIS